MVYCMDDWWGMVLDVCAPCDWWDLSAGDCGSDACEVRPKRKTLYFRRRIDVFRCIDACHGASFDTDVSEDSFHRLVVVPAGGICSFGRIADLPGNLPPSQRYDGTENISIRKLPAQSCAGSFYKQISPSSSEQG